MRSYKFSMEKILNLRESKEKNILEEMNSIRRKLEEQEITLRKLLKDANKLRKESYNNILELQYHNLQKSKLRDDIDEKNKEIDGILIELEDVRQELVEAQKERKIMEKLKEKDKEKYIKNIQSQEQKELDEIAVLKYKAK